MSEATKGNAEVSKNRKGYADVQGAPRFPIKLPVALKSPVNHDLHFATGPDAAGDASTAL